MNEAEKKALAAASDARRARRLTGRQRALLAAYFRAAGDRVVERVLSAEAIDRIIQEGDIFMLQRWFEIASIAGTCWTWMVAEEMKEPQAAKPRAQV